MPFAALVWWMSTRPLPDMVTLWPQVSANVRDTAQLLGPLAGGLAAWLAGRAQRSKVEEQLVTTPSSAGGREFTTWAAATIWVVLAYTAGTAAVLVQASLKATWGAPLAFPIVIALVFTVTSAALGYAAGTWVRSRFTAPLTAIILLATLTVPDIYPYSLRYLSVFSERYSIFTRAYPDITWLHVWWLLGLSGLAVGAIALKHHRNSLSVGLLLVGAVASLAAAAFVVRAGDTVGRVSIPYDSLCVEADIEVCIHPAYEAMQLETLGVISRMTGPLADVPGAPSKAEQVPLLERWGFSSDGTLRFELHEVVSNNEYNSSGYDSLVRQIAMSLVYDERTSAGGISEAQKVIRAWLIQQAGIPVCQQIGSGTACADVGNLAPQIERFAALEPQVRDAWLHDNYAALTRGELTLEDLP
jgi:hypothetical protein